MTVSFFWGLPPKEVKLEEQEVPKGPTKSRKKRNRMAGPVKEVKAVTTVEEKEKFTAEAQAFLAEADLHKAETRKEIAEAKQAEILLAAKKRAEADELAKNSHNYVYPFDQAVSEGSVKSCIGQLTTWTRQKPKCEIEIQINSPGGTVIDGFALVDFIFDLRHKGHTINTVALGAAASMAGVLLQAGDTRIMGPNAFLLIHEAQFGAMGSFGKIEDQVQFVKLMHDRILGLFAERAQPINKKTTKTFIKRQWNRKDWWMNAETALELGFIDEVR